MTGETIQFEQAAAAAAPGDESGKREQSTIAFPYHDLDAAIEVAQAAYNRSGLGSCDLDELAAEMGQVISGAFRVKLAAARTFDLLDKDGRSAVKLSELGRRIITEDNSAAAKAEAFMSVPLYAKVYEAYKGQKLPPMKALEREMAALGVAVKQTDKARQAFERAAKQAGFFDAGSDRLVRPRVEVHNSPPREQDDDTKRGAGDGAAGDGGRSDSGKGRHSGGGGSGGGKDHPLINGLLVTLPEPGKAWDQAGRKAWLKMAESIFDMIYTTPSQGGPTVAASEEIDELLG